MEQPINYSVGIYISKDTFHASIIAMSSNREFTASYGKAIINKNKIQLVNYSKTPLGEQPVGSLRGVSIHNVVFKAL